MDTCIAVSREETRYTIVMGSLMLACIFAGVLIGYLYTFIPGTTSAGGTFLGALTAICWMVGALSDNSEYEISPVWVLAYALITVVASCIFGLAGMFWATVAIIVFAIGSGEGI